MTGRRLRLHRWRRSRSTRARRPSGLGRYPPGPSRRPRAPAAAHACLAVCRSAGAHPDRGGPRGDASARCAALARVGVPAQPPIAGPVGGRPVGDRPVPRPRRPRRRIARPVGARLGGAGGSRGRPVLVAAVRRRRPPALAARARRDPAPIISGDALLPDHTDLLRELDPAHRARVHDHRRGHRRPASPPARRRHLVPDRCGRARGQGGARRGGAGAHAAGVHRPDRHRLAGGAAAGQRDQRLLHPHER